MNLAVRVDRKGGYASLAPSGAFDLVNATAAARAVVGADECLAGCSEVEVDLAEVCRIDGAGAVLLARFLDRLDAAGHHAYIIQESNRDAAHLISLYRERRTDRHRSRGFAFIEMSEVGDAQAAVMSLDGTFLNGRPLRVNEARPKLVPNFPCPLIGRRDHRYHRI